MRPQSVLFNGTNACGQKGKKKLFHKTHKSNNEITHEDPKNITSHDYALQGISHIFSKRSF